MPQSYVKFSETETNCGVEYAKEKYDFSVDPNFLRYLANRTRGHMSQARLSFKTARFEVLNGSGLDERSPAAKQKRDAYEGALGKMFAERKKYTRGRKGTPPMAKHPTNAKGQLEWVF